MALEKELQNLGLSEKEAKVYLALLELGSATAQAIAKKAGVNRATTYFVLNSLVAQGLAGETDDNKTTKYAAENPDQLEVLLKKKEEEIKASERRFKELLPELRSVYNRLENKPIVRYHDGKEGPRLIREEMLKLQNEEVYLFYNYDKAKNVFTEEETLKFRKNKERKNLQTFAIYTTKENDFELKSSDSVKFYKVDQGKYPVHGDISVYGSVVKISKFLSENNIGVITIDDQEMAETFKSLFKLALNYIKKKGQS